jgi:hypothetical protein
MGYLWQKDGFSAAGFASIMVPTDSDDVTVAFPDQGEGYWVFRSGASSRASCRRWNSCNLR